jgi:hypothetical protein
MVMSNTSAPQLTLSDLVAEHVTADVYTPYAAIKVVNGIIAAMGIERVLPPQMGYNYNRNGMLGAKGSKSVTADELKAWAVKYITKNLLS